MTAQRQPEEVRLPPHSQDAEQAVIGACLIDRDVIVQLAPQLEPSDFMQHAHSIMWSALLALYQRRVPPDLLLVTEELRQQGKLADVGGEAYVAELIDATPTAVHALYYAGIVKEASIRRGLIRAAQAITRAAWNESLAIEDVTAQADAAIHEAIRLKSRDGYRMLSDILSAAYDRMGKQTEPAIPTGLGPLDNLIRGYKPGNLIVIAARPGDGKSAIAGQMADLMARRGLPVGIISMEMDEAELAARFLAMNSGQNLHALSHETITDNDPRWGPITDAIGRLSPRRIAVDDRADTSLVDVLARARTMHAEVGIRVLFVDYLQLMKVGRGGGERRAENRNQEIGQISRELKLLARELGIVVVTLAQLSRAVETRKPPIPMLSDLRDSGEVEQNADQVMFIHRPDNYDTSAPANVAHMMVAKHRSGPKGMVRMQFVPETAQFLSIPKEGV